MERIAFRTRGPVDISRLAERDDPVGWLLAALGDLQEDEDELSALAADLAQLKRKLPAELQRDEDGLRFDSVESLRQALRDVAELLPPRLTSRRSVS